MRRRSPDRYPPSSSPGYRGHFEGQSPQPQNGYHPERQYNPIAGFGLQPNYMWHHWNNNAANNRNHRYYNGLGNIPFDYNNRMFRYNNNGVFGNQNYRGFNQQGAFMQGGYPRYKLAGSPRYVVGNPVAFGAIHSIMAIPNYPGFVNRAFYRY